MFLDKVLTYLFLYVILLSQGGIMIYKKVVKVIIVLLFIVIILSTMVVRVSASSDRGERKLIESSTY